MIFGNSLSGASLAVTSEWVQHIADCAPHIHKIFANVFCATYQFFKECSCLERSKKTLR